ncbi:MAG: class I SAM-dependent methyltransferase [Clostridia bacterium]|nr:class I SAM-dependent methyltransferase [Clostridia bacterium]
MRISKFEDYELIDASCGEKLERFGDIILIRPDPQIIWNTPKVDPMWRKAHAKYIRSTKGGGYWEVYKKIPDVWTISYKDLKFRLKPMGFKHTGIFPEQAVNWDFVSDVVSKSSGNMKILNLFAYTGGATMAALSAGAEVCHVDASKGMTLWAKENVKESGLQDKSVRFIVDDCLKFVQREKRRNHFYDAIIMDPPSYGRGPNGEVWKLEEGIFNLLNACSEILSENARFFILNSYTAGLSCGVMAYLLNATIAKNRSGVVFSSEIGLPLKASKLVLPCGSTSIWQASI